MSTAGPSRSVTAAGPGRCTPMGPERRGSQRGRHHQEVPPANSANRLLRGCVRKPLIERGRQVNVSQITALYARIYSILLSEKHDGQVRTLIRFVSWPGHLASHSPWRRHPVLCCSPPTPIAIATHDYASIHSRVRSSLYCDSQHIRKTLHPIVHRLSPPSHRTAHASKSLERLTRCTFTRVLIARIVYIRSQRHDEACRVRSLHPFPRASHHVTTELSPVTPARSQRFVNTSTYTSTYTHITTLQLLLPLKTWRRRGPLTAAAAHRSA